MPVVLPKLPVRQRYRLTNNLLALVKQMRGGLPVASETSGNQRENEHRDDDASVNLVRQRTLLRADDRTDASLDLFRADTLLRCRADDVAVRITELQNERVRNNGKLLLCDLVFLFWAYAASPHWSSLVESYDKLMDDYYEGNVTPDAFKHRLAHLNTLLPGHMSCQEVFDVGVDVNNTYRRLRKVSSQAFVLNESAEFEFPFDLDTTARKLLTYLRAQTLHRLVP